MTNPEEWGQKPIEGWERLAEEPERWRYLEAKSAILRAVRNYFFRKGFLEVETPILSEYEGFDPHLKNARVEMPLGGKVWRGFLQTSPEYEMKMLIAGGGRRMFQVFRAVRADERTRWHHPEFSLLEWYRVDGNYRALMKDMEGLVRAAARSVGLNETVEYQGQKISLKGPFRVTPFFEGLCKATGADEKTVRSVEGLAEVVGKRIPPFAGEKWTDYVLRVFALEVQPRLGIPRPEFIVDYPAELGTMARGRADRPDLYERVELFIAGIELANGYTELADEAEQRRRFEEIARETGKRIPEKFLKALKRGIGECAGCALGIDRLVMVLTNARDISEVLPFAIITDG